MACFHSNWSHPRQSQPRSLGPMQWRKNSRIWTPQKCHTLQEWPFWTRISGTMLDLWESFGGHKSGSSPPSKRPIPHICHLDHLYIGGEKLVMWKNFRFEHMTDVEKSEISPRVEEFQISHTTYPVFGCEICLWQFTLFFV